MKSFLSLSWCYSNGAVCVYPHCLSGWLRSRGITCFRSLLRRTDIDRTVASLSLFVCVWIASVWLRLRLSQWRTRQPDSPPLAIKTTSSISLLLISNNPEMTTPPASYHQEISHLWGHLVSSVSLHVCKGLTAGYDCKYEIQTTDNEVCNDSWMDINNAHTGRITL